MTIDVSAFHSIASLRGVQVPPSEHGDRVAFVCAHIPHTTDVSTSLYAFKSLLMARGGKATFDKDYEIVLGLKGNTLSEDETAALIVSLIDQRLDLDVSLADHIDSATLGFRMMGISPTQAIQNKDMSFQLRQVLNFAACIGFFSLMSGLQIGGDYYGGAQYQVGNLQTLIMGILGYCGTAAFTLILLVLIKKEVVVEQQTLPAVFDKAIWTFSDSRHAEHRALDLPAQGAFVTASPASFNASQKRRRQTITLVVWGGLTGSYVVFYLGIRAAQWWVALGSLAIIWLSAGFRAVVVRNNLTAKRKEQLGEHWLGLFRDCLRVPSRNCRHTSNPQRRICHTRKFQ